MFGNCFLQFPFLLLTLEWYSKAVNIHPNSVLAFLNVPAVNSLLVHILFSQILPFHNAAVTSWKIYDYCLMESECFVLRRYGILENIMAWLVACHHVSWRWHNIDWTENMSGLYINFNYRFGFLARGSQLPIVIFKSKTSNNVTDMTSWLLKMCQNFNVGMLPDTQH